MMRSTASLSCPANCSSVTSGICTSPRRSRASRACAAAMAFRHLLQLHTFGHLVCGRDQAGRTGQTGQAARPAKQHVHTQRELLMVALPLGQKIFRHTAGKGAAAHDAGTGSGDPGRFPLLYSAKADSRGVIRVFSLSLMEATQGRQRFRTGDEGECGLAGSATRTVPQWKRNQALTSSVSSPAPARPWSRYRTAKGPGPPVPGSARQAVHPQRYPPGRARKHASGQAGTTR